MTEYIIQLEDTSGKKIYLNPEGSAGIYLYPGDIRKLRLQNGDRLSEEEIEQIRINYVIPRAKKRALGILAKRDCTKKQLIEKLEKSFYDNRSIEDAVYFLESYGYLDDLSYAREYIYYKKSKKSIRQIQFDLQRKGIDSTTIALALEEEGGQQSKEDLRKLFEKYSRKYDKKEAKDRQKVYMYFARKGYDRELILGLIEEWETEKEDCS